MGVSGLGGSSCHLVKPVDFEQFMETARILGLYWILMNRPSTIPGSWPP